MSALIVISWIDLGAFLFLGIIQYVIATFLLKMWARKPSNPKKKGNKAYYFAQTPVHLLAVASLTWAFVSGLRLVGYDSVIQLLDADATGEVLGVQAYDLTWAGVSATLFWVYAALLAFFAVGYVEGCMSLVFFIFWGLLNFGLARANSVYIVIFFSSIGFLLVVASLWNVSRLTPVKLYPINGWTLAVVVWFVLTLVTTWVFTILVNPYMQLTSSIVLYTTTQIVFSAGIFGSLVVMTVLIIVGMPERKPYIDGEWELLYPMKDLMWFEDTKKKRENQMRNGQSAFSVEF